VASPTEIIAAAVAELRRAYVLPDRLPAVEARLADRLRAGAYTGLIGRALCDAITADIRTACPDRHLRLRWSDEPDAPIGYQDPASLDRYWQEAAVDNYGVHEVSRLPGNVGYFDLRAIDDADHTAPALTAAMTLLANTAALLLDLRRNGGGAPSGVAYLCSFFFPSQPPVHLNDVYDRASDTTQQYWTVPYLPVAPYAGSIWVLVSNDTFSGGEEIAYNLQQLKRATLVGAVTRGGAHPTDEFRLTPHVSIRVPTQRSINPISGTNWEGAGVVPDVEMPPDKAKNWAYGAALRKIVADLGDEPPPAHRVWRDEASTALAGWIA
jgi:hypothetical protein